MINVVVKLLKIVHNMEHSQLITYIRRISFTRSCLFLVLFCKPSQPTCVRHLVLGCLTRISSVQVNRKFKKFKFSGNCQVVTFKFTLPLDQIKLSQTATLNRICRDNHSETNNSMTCTLVTCILNQLEYHSCQTEYHFSKPENHSGLSNIGFLQAPTSDSTHGLYQTLSQALLIMRVKNGPIFYVEVLLREFILVAYSKRCVQTFPGKFSLNIHGGQVGMFIVSTQSQQWK